MNLLPLLHSSVPSLSPLATQVCIYPSRASLSFSLSLSLARALSLSRARALSLSRPLALSLSRSRSVCMCVLFPFFLLNLPFVILIAGTTRCSATKTIATKSRRAADTTVTSSVCLWAQTRLRCV